MPRALLALFLAPALVSAIHGFIAPVVLFFMWVVTTVLAVPLFFLFRRVGWLQWWHACLAGASCGLMFTAVYSLSLSAEYLEWSGTSMALGFAGTGALTGLVFWWLGLFRNRAFPEVGRHFPLAMLVLAPLSLVGYMAFGALEQRAHAGRLLEVAESPPGAANTGRAKVRLKEGKVVETDLSAEHLAYAKPRVGRCFHVMHGWSALKLRYAYYLVGEFGANGDDC